MILFIGGIHDHLAGSDILADYLLYELNKKNEFSYVEKLKLNEPNDNLQEVLNMVCQKFGYLSKGNKYDYIRACNYFLRLYRSGQIGKFVLDPIINISSDDVTKLINNYVLKINTDKSSNQLKKKKKNEIMKKINQKKRNHLPKY